MPLYRRALRRLLTPVSRCLVRFDRRIPSVFQAQCEPAVQDLRVFMILVPGTEEIAQKNCATLAGHCRLCLVLNGYSRERSRDLENRFAPLPVIRLRTLPGSPVKHGTALTFLLDHAEENFGIIDPDCFIRRPELLNPPMFEEREFLAAPDLPGFFNTNRATGERFPRTHYLVANVAPLRKLMSEQRINAEKYSRAPKRLEAALASRGYGKHNYPRSHLRHFDTLLLLMAVAFQQGLRVHWLEADPGEIIHWRR